MIHKKTLLYFAMAIGLGVLTACSLISPETSFAPTHPQELGNGRPTCTTCHEDAVLKGSGKQFSTFDHTPDFVKNHRFQASSDSGVCAACHAQSFCTTCHAATTPMKPSVMLGNRPDRVSPHKGDYMALHRMEGRQDPTSCYQCHGRANNEMCITCHK